MYLRVSTEDQDLQRQEAIIGNARASDYYVAAVYREKASGARSDRPELLRMRSNQPSSLGRSRKACGRDQG
ncbi:Stability/partitioning determinant [Pseudomonas savastanoi pv. fraxini]|nr:Stability/partitioning determinant [Pseudomonas savastanoi pv. fraxini]